MTAIEKRTSEELIEAVGALIDMEVTTNSSPTKTQVCRWLTDGAIQIFSLLPKEALADCVKTVDDTDTTVHESLFTTNDILRIVGVERNEILCKKISEEEYGALSLTPYKYTELNPAYTVIRRANGIEVKVLPYVSALDVLVKYIPYPMEYEVSGTATDNDVPVPAPLEPMMIEYATIMYRNQDEEPAQFQLYMAEWKEKLKMMYSIPSDNVEGGTA